MPPRRNGPTAPLPGASVSKKSMTSVVSCHAWMRWPSARTCSKPLVERSLVRALASSLALRAAASALPTAPALADALHVAAARLADLPPDAAKFLPAQLVPSSGWLRHGCTG